MQTTIIMRWVQLSNFAANANEEKSHIFQLSMHNLFRNKTTRCELEKSINFSNYFRLSKSSHILDDDVKLIIIFIIITHALSRALCTEWMESETFFSLHLLSFNHPTSCFYLKRLNFTFNFTVVYITNLFGLETGFSSLQHQPKWNVIYFQLDQRAAVRQFRVVISWRCCFSNRLSVLMHPTTSSSRIRLVGWKNC